MEAKARDHRSQLLFTWPRLGFAVRRTSLAGSDFLADSTHACRLHRTLRVHTGYKTFASSSWPKRSIRISLGRNCRSALPLSNPIPPLRNPYGPVIIVVLKSIHNHIVTSATHSQCPVTPSCSSGATPHVGFDYRFARSNPLAKLLDKRALEMLLEL
jgi:hypothetical protein